VSEKWERVITFKSYFQICSIKRVRQDLIVTKNVDREAFTGNVFKFNLPQYGIGG
jgi:hypothetical protein